MLFTIVDDNKQKPSFRGLLFIGDEIPESAKETASSMNFIDAGHYVREAVQHVSDALEDVLCFVKSDNEYLREALKLRGYKFYRVLDMDNGGRGM